MKTIFKLFAITCVMFGMLFTSCSKDGSDGLPGANGADGANGVNGANGVDGVAGVDGDDGDDGVNGNANVATYIYEFTDNFIAGLTFPRLSLEFETPMLTTEVVKDDAILYFIFDKNGYSIAVPGTFNNESIEAVVLASLEPEVTPSITTLLFGAPITDPLTHEIEYFKIVVIKSSSSELGKGGSSKAAIFAELKQAGVDANDYEAVMDYYYGKDY